VKLDLLGSGTPDQRQTMEESSMVFRSVQQTVILP